MVAVLGVSAHYHDSAAALVVDGQVIAAAAEERFSRVLHDSGFPVRAIHFCLEHAGIQAGDLDAVVFYELPFLKLERILLESVRGFPWTSGSFVRGVRSQLSDKLWILDRLAESLDLPRSKVKAVSHHDSHAASAFYVSPFEEAAVLTVDGVGEHTTTAIWKGEGRELRPLWSTELPASLGLFYSAITAFVGFEVLQGECKLMGLSAFGEPRFEDALSRVLRCHDDGSFDVDASYVDVTGASDKAFKNRLCTLLGEPRPYGRSWNLEAGSDRRYADVAASAQGLLERAMFGLARRAQRETGSKYLCLAGGVALNCVVNGKLASAAGFEGIFVQPAASDAGGALGAALLGAIALGGARPPPMRSAALGLPIDAGHAKDLALALGLSVSAPPSIAADAAQRLASGQVIAWAEGRAEFGPRALGHRSLLARADDVGLRDLINRRVKGREPFRPFAPSVLDATAGRLAREAPNDMTRFMTAVYPVDEAQRTEVAATLHVDGTARIHSVDPAAEPRFGALLEAYTQASGRCALLDTSLNTAGEPIVNSSEDAIALFVAHPEVRALYVDELVIERPT